MLQCSCCKPVLTPAPAALQQSCSSAPVTSYCPASCSSAPCEPSGRCLIRNSSSIFELPDPVWAGRGRGSGWLAAGCDVCPAAPNCRCDTRTFVSSLLNQHLKGKCGINVGQSTLISGNKIVRTIRAVRVTAVSSVTSQLTWQLYTLHPQQLPAVNPCHWAAGC